MKNIYVGNLSFDATEDQVRSLFEAYGAVDKVSIVTDRDTGQPRGFAFVEMTDDDGANKAIEALNGTNLGGRNLNINEARPRPTARVAAVAVAAVVVVTAAAAEAVATADAPAAVVVVAATAVARRIRP